MLHRRSQFHIQSGAQEGQACRADILFCPASYAPDCFLALAPGELKQIIKLGNLATSSSQPRSNFHQVGWWWWGSGTEGWEIYSIPAGVRMMALSLEKCSQESSASCPLSSKNNRDDGSATTLLPSTGPLYVLCASTSLSSESPLQFMAFVWGSIHLLSFHRLFYGFWNMLSHPNVRRRFPKARGLIPGHLEVSWLRKEAGVFSSLKRQLAFCLSGYLCTHIPASASPLCSPAVLGLF